MSSSGPVADSRHPYRSNAARPGDTTRCSTPRRKQMPGAPLPWRASQQGSRCLPVTPSSVRAIRADDRLELGKVCELVDAVLVGEEVVGLVRRSGALVHPEPAHRTKPTRSLGNAGVLAGGRSRRTPAGEQNATAQDPAGSAIAQSNSADPACWNAFPRHVSPCVARTRVLF